MTLLMSTWACAGQVCHLISLQFDTEPVHTVHAYPPCVTPSTLDHGNAHATHIIMHAIQAAILYPLVQ